MRVCRQAIYISRIVRYHMLVHLFMLSESVFFLRRRDAIGMRHVEFMRLYACVYGLLSVPDPKRLIAALPKV